MRRHANRRDPPSWPRSTSPASRHALPSRLALPCSDLRFTRRGPDGSITGHTREIVTLLLSITFACGLFIAGAHVINTHFVAPVYDVIANLTAFASAVCASSLLRHWVPAALSAVAFALWIVLAHRTRTARKA